MAVGKKYFDSANLLQLAMAFSMLRPELQGFIGQNTTPPMPAYPQYQQNYTGVAFEPSSTSNFNFHVVPKEAAADYNNPLSEFLDWHTTGQNRFNGDGVAMLFDGVDSQVPREARSSFSTELESGYSSDGARSPLSSVAGSPHHDHESSAGNFQLPNGDFNNFGAAAAGFTLSGEEEVLKSMGNFELEDYIDLDVLYEGPPQKKAFLPEDQTFNPNIKAEPLSPVDSYRKFPSSPPQSYVPSDFARKSPLDEISVEPFNFDGPFSTDSIDFIPTAEELQHVGEDVDTEFDFASWADNLNFENDLALDIFDPRPPAVQNAVENKHDTLLPLGQELVPVFSEAGATRNDSGGSFSETAREETHGIGGNWESRSLPLLSSATIKQEKPDFSGPSTSTSSRFAPTKAPRDCKDAKPKIGSSSSSSHFASEEEIVDMSIAEFNTFLETLSEVQAQEARDIRRRGKNKVAARLCRKRKIEVVSDIEEEINTLRKQKEDVLNQRKKLQAENAYYKSKIIELQDHLFKSLRDESGRPLSPNEYSLFQGDNGSIYVGKNIVSESKKKQSRG